MRFQVNESTHYTDASFSVKYPSTFSVNNPKQSTYLLLMEVAVLKEILFTSVLCNVKLERKNVKRKIYMTTGILLDGCRSCCHSH